MDRLDSLPVPPSDLADLEVWGIWKAGLRQQGVQNQEIVSLLLRTEIPLGLLRAATVAHRIRPQPRDDIREWLRRAYVNGDRAAQLLALALSIFFQTEGPLRAGVRDHEVSDSSISGLEALLQETRTLPSHPLRLEVEFRLLSSLLQANLIVKHVQNAERISGQMLALAELSGSRTMRGWGRESRAHALNLVGRFDKGAALRWHQLAQGEELTSDADRDRVTLNLAIALMNLGSVARGRQVLQTRLSERPLEAPLRAWMHWMDAFAGDNPSGDEPEFSSTASAQHRWQVEALRLLGAASSLPPVGKSATEQRRLYQQTLGTVPAQQDRLPGDEALAVWARARARLWLGEFGMAAQDLAAVPALEDEDLLIRAWVAALQLELAMTPLAVLARPLPVAEADLRGVFELARQLHFADAHGLAQLVARWHPAAAAYASVMPEPIPEFAVARDAVLHCGVRSTWRGKVVPPALAASLTLRTFGLHSPFSLGGNAYYQASRLSTGPAQRWGPIVPPAALVLALGRGEAAHRAAAQRVLADFGGVPRLVSQHPPTRELGTLLQQLAAGSLEAELLLGQIADLSV